MYGAIINDINMNNIGYFFNRELDTTKFTAYTGSYNFMALARMDKSKFKEFKLDNYENSKIFVRKKTPFQNKAEAIHQGADEIYSSVLGLDCLFIEKRQSNYYIVCVNPTDFVFLEYVQCNVLKSNPQYGLEIYDERGVKLYTSDAKPCLLHRVVDVKQLCNDNVFVKVTNSNYSTRNQIFNNLLDLQQNNVVHTNAYCELGVTCAFNKILNRQHWNYKELSGFYSLLIDSNGVLKYTLCFGLIYGSMGIIRGRNDFGGGTTVTISRASKHIGLIK